MKWKEVPKLSYAIIEDQLKITILQERSDGQWFSASRIIPHCSCMSMNCGLAQLEMVDLCKNSLIEDIKCYLDLKSYPFQAAAIHVDNYNS
jgi:hypothetical protein